VSSLRLADPAASWAVLAGVPHYENLADIPQVSKNIAALGAALGDARIWGLPSSQIDIVQPENIRDHFFVKVGAAARKATDTLIVYYAGHGLPDPQSGELYLGLPGTERGSVEAALRYEFLSRRLADPTRAVRNTVVILDCCFSGRAVLNGRMSASEDLATLAEIPGSCLLAASAPTQTALAPPGEAYTAFTGVLVDMLRQGVASGDRLLSVSVLHEHAVRRLSKVQTPQLRTDGTGNRVCFARNVGYTSAASATTVSGVPDAGGQSVTALIRQRLKYLRRVKGFNVVQPGLHESKFANRARQAHALDADEELIGVWQFRSSLLRFPDSLIVTSRGIRVKDGSRRIFISYAAIRDYEFACDRIKSFRASGNAGAIPASAYVLKVSGPDESWSGPSSWSSDDIEDIVIMLSDIQQMPVGPANNHQ